VLQRNITGYTLVVQPPDGSHGAPFELAPDETVDYPDPIAGCATAEPATAEPAPADQAAAKPATKTPAKTKAADGGAS
jgi:hypothetical protein